ncbi:MAG: ribonuclease P protein component [Thermomicrobiales bacterium]
MVERKLRLRRGGDVRRARGKGRAWADGPLVARVIRNDTEPAQNRYAVVAGKKAGKAVQRNRLKRLVRETIRHHHPRLAPGHDIVVIVRGTVDEMPGLAETERAFGRIVRRAGLLVEGPAGGDSAGPRPPRAAPGGGAAEPPRVRPAPGGVRGDPRPAGRGPGGQAGESGMAGPVPRADVPVGAIAEGRDSSARPGESPTSRPDPEISR